MINAIYLKRINSSGAHMEPFGGNTMLVFIYLLLFVFTSLSVLCYFSFKGKLGGFVPFRHFESLAGSRNEIQNRLNRSSGTALTSMLYNKVGGGV